MTADRNRRCCACRIAVAAANPMQLRQRDRHRQRRNADSWTDDLIRAHGDDALLRRRPEVECVLGGHDHNSKAWAGGDGLVWSRGRRPAGMNRVGADRGQTDRGHDRGDGRRRHELLCPIARPGHAGQTGQGVCRREHQERRQPGSGAPDIGVQAFERTPQPAPDGTHRDPEDGRDLAVATALKVGKGDNAPLLRVQLGHAAADGVPVESRSQRLPRPGVGRTRLAIICQQLPCAAVASAPPARIDGKGVHAGG